MERYHSVDHRNALVAAPSGNGAGRVALLVHIARTAEVADLDLVVARQQQVARGQVPVDEPSFRRSIFFHRLCGNNSFCASAQNAGSIGEAGK